MKSILRLSVFVFAAVSSVLFLSCSKTVYQASRYQTPASDSLDFSYLDMNSDAVSGIYYRVMHTDSVLVFEIAVLDEVSQRKILMNGLNVFIDSTNKSQKTTGFQYPVRLTNTPLPGEEPKIIPLNDKPGTGNHDMIKLIVAGTAKEIPVSKNIQAGFILNKNQVLMLRVAIACRELGLNYASLKDNPFSVILITTPLKMPKALEGGRDNGAQEREVMTTNQSMMHGQQTPFGQTTPGMYGQPGGGVYYNSSSPSTQDGASKTDKITIRSIVLSE